MDGVTKYAMTFVPSDNPQGEWKFVGNALAVHTKKTEPFTVDYMVEYEEKPISDGVITGTIQSVQDPGMGHESHQIAMIFAPSPDVYSGILSYSASQPIQLISLRGPIGPDEHPEKTWTVDGNTVFEMMFVDPANAMGKYTMCLVMKSQHLLMNTDLQVTMRLSGMRVTTRVAFISINLQLRILLKQKK